MNCIFCKIIEGSIPCYKVYEDDYFVGFLDIAPLSKGNVLLIPKKHYRWVNDVPNFGEYWEAARKIGQSIEKQLSAISISYLTIGDEVPHAHIRIVPRYEGESLYLSLKKPEKVSGEEMKFIQEKIKINTI